MKTIAFNIQCLVNLAGFAQIALVIGSTFIPGILKWKSHLANVYPLIKQMFWTYAAYILVINLCFGLVSVFAAADLVNGSKLAVLVSGFIAVYWFSRLMIQFFGLDRANFPAGPWHKFAEVVLVTVFIFLTTVYSLAFYHNYSLL